MENDDFRGWPGTHGHTSKAIATRDDSRHFSKGLLPIGQGEQTARNLRYWEELTTMGVSC